LQPDLIACRKRARHASPLRMQSPLRKGDACVALHLRRPPPVPRRNPTFGGAASTCWVSVIRQLQSGGLCRKSAQPTCG
jgi:hypothetical protein